MAEPSNADIIALLKSIEERLSALERRGAAPPVSAPPTRSATVPVAQMPVAPPSFTPPPVAPPAAPPAATSAPVPPPVRPVDGARPVTPPSFQPVGTAAAPPPAPRSAEPARLERFVGIQVAAWIGAIVVIAAIGIFAKFAIDQGWFRDTPPSLKLAMAYALSGAFAVAGSLLRGTLGRLPAGAMLGAGIGGLFVSTCAGVTPLDVFGPNAGLIAGAAVAVLAGALTLRSRELSVGALAIIGAYVVPAFTGTLTLSRDGAGEPPLAGALYLTAVYSVALLLAWLGPPSFTWLRFAGLFQAIGGAMLIIGSGSASPAISLGFTALWWGMAVSECSLAALRGRSPHLNTAFTVAATLIAATLTLRGAVATDPWTDIQSWLPMMMAAAAVIGAVQIRSLVPAGGPDQRDRSDDPEGFAVAAATARQSSVLIVLAIGLALAQVGVVVRGGALPVTWTAMGVAAIVIGRRTGQAGSARLGAVSVMLGLLATLAYLILRSGAAVTVLEYPSDPDLRIGSMWAFRFADIHWAPLLVSLGLFVSAYTWSIGSDPTKPPPRVSTLLASCASALWIGLSLAVASRYAVVVLLLAIPVTATLAGRSPRLIWSTSLLGSAVAALAWSIVTVSHISRYVNSDDVRPAGGAVAAALIVASFWMLGWRFRHERSRDYPTVIGFAFGLAALALLLWIEQVAGATSSSVTAATIWTCIAVAAVATVGGTAARQSGLESSAGLGLVATVIAAVVTLFAVVADAGSPPAEISWTDHSLLNPANAGALVMLLCGLALRAAFARAPSLGAAAGIVAAAAFLIGTGALVYRIFDPRIQAPFHTTQTLQQSALSVWLAIAAVVLIVIGFRRGSRGTRWTGLVILGLVALKVLVLDMANAGTIWRVAALLVIGLLLVATSAVYSRAAKALPAEAPQAPPQ